MEITELRNKIDAIDDAIIQLFCRRMEISSEIAAYKKDHGLSIQDDTREQEKLESVAKKSTPGMSGYTKSLYQTLFTLSKSYQGKCSITNSALFQALQNAICEEDSLPAEAAVACLEEVQTQSEEAGKQFVRSPRMQAEPALDDIYTAVEQGSCRYGLIPYENGPDYSMKSVFDKCIRHHLYLVRRLTPDQDPAVKATSPSFLCVSKELEIHPHSAKTALVTILPQTPGALYAVLSRFALLGINIAKMESSAAAGPNAECVFYFELDLPADPDQFRALLSELDSLPNRYWYLGSFCEETL